MEHSVNPLDWVPEAPCSPNSWGTQSKKGVLEATRGDAPKPDLTHHLACGWTKSIPAEGGDCTEDGERTTRQGAGVQGGTGIPSWVVK